MAASLERACVRKAVKCRAHLVGGHGELAMTLRAQAADMAIDLCQRRCAATFVTLGTFFVEECCMRDDVVAKQRRGSLLIKADLVRRRYRVCFSNCN
ncbi:hypothetical protein B6S44_26325 [Bosea sp. Tri-44]|nr:hypothetical protein B6S44_26325 [Bosea sp. Tri-44]